MQNNFLEDSWTPNEKNSPAFESARQVCILNNKPLKDWFLYVEEFEKQCYDSSDKIVGELEKCSEKVQKAIKADYSSIFNECFGSQLQNKSNRFYAVLMENQKNDEQFYDISPSVKINDQILRVKQQLNLGKINSN